jgi:uncharacterized protein YcbK (DUF882 family)
MEKLEELRELVNAPIHITSAYRCPEHNKAVGGATNSMHLNFCTDIYVKGMLMSDLSVLAKQVGFLGIGIASNFVHVDLKLPARSWNYGHRT